MQVADASRRARTSAALAAAAALAFGLSFPLSDTFVALWPLAFVWPALLALAALSAPRARLLWGFVGIPFAIAFLAHEWWMRHITELGMPLLVLYLAGWTVLLALLIRRLALARTDASGHTRAGWPLALALPVALVSIECLRGELVCSGYAWFFTAHPLAEWTALAQISALGGNWLLTALAGLVAGAAFDSFHARGRVRIASPAVALAALVAALAYGHARIDAVDAERQSSAARPRILVVQTNLPMSNKLSWAPEQQVEDFVRFARLTLDGARTAGTAVDLALWPETTVPGLGLEPESLRTLVEGDYYPGDRFEEGLRDLSRRIGAPLIVGSPAYLALRVEANRFAWDHQYNSAYLVGPEGVLGRTDKIYLTPFGEMMPIISNWDWLETQLLALGANGMTFDLDTADRPAALRVPLRAGDGGSLAVGVPICFEITQSWASRRIVFPDGSRAAGIVANLSNDGWFDTSRAGRRQHLQVAQLRAIELDTPVVRCVNTGMSAEIDRAGRVRGLLPPGQADSLVAEPVPATGRPVSVWLTPWISTAALLLAAIGLVPARSAEGAPAPAKGAPS